MTHPSPLRLLGLLACSIFVAELLIMFLLPLLPPLPAWGAAMLDASLLVILAFPVLFTFMFRPLLKEIGNRQQAEGELRKAQSDLETRVKERAAELLAANKALQEA